MKTFMTRTVRRVYASHCNRSIGVSFLVLISFVCFVPTTLAADPDTEPHKIFLPVVTSTTAPTCQLNAQETALEELLRNHPNQGRVTLACNPTLAAVARARALDMGQRAYFGHTNPDGYGPNYLVRQAGYELPIEYSTAINANNIESIGAGAGNAEGMWNAWMNSTSHLTHILGSEDFYAEQVEYGIGFAQVPGSPYQFYWVFISS
ncbi:MAG: hypothetical protein KDE19_06400, partial [Caldilineaceae bacterium]|nr:hypothetical protein [Caldilineaceae bacterium]